MIPSLETLLTEISERGWRVSNLSQLPDGSWRANLYTDFLYTDFASADTPSGALSLAIDQIESSKPYIAHQTKAYIGSNSFEPKAIDLSAILSKLNPTVAIKRRI